MSEIEICDRLGIEYDKNVGAPYICIHESGESVTLDSAFSADDLRKIADEMDRVKEARREVRETMSEIKPTEKDREKAASVVRAWEATLTSVAVPGDVKKELVDRVARALASQREDDAQKCDAIALQFSAEDTGESHNKKDGALACAAAIRTDPSEGVEKQ